MARIVPGKDVSPILAASRSWIEQCLIGDGSIFSQGDRIWTTDALKELRIRFIENPLEDDRRFFDKLQEQMRECAPATKRLMAEMLWMARLFPSNISPTTKRKQVNDIHRASGKELSPDHPMLVDEVLSGIGSAGPRRPPCFE